SFFPTRDVALGEEDIFRHLENMEDTQDGVLSFARRWRLLGRSSSLSDFYAAKDAIRWALDSSRIKGMKRVADEILRNGNIGSAHSPFQPASQRGSRVVRECNCPDAILAARALRGARGGGRNGDIPQGRRRIPPPSHQGAGPRLLQQQVPTEEIPRCEPRRDQ